MTDIYKERLIAFCEGLEMENINELIELAPDDIKEVGKAVAKIIKWITIARME